VKNADTAIQTFLGPETTLEGKLAFEGTVRLDGHFTGTIESKDGVVIIGDEAVIRADILVHTATVSGEVSGNIKASHCIELHPPARVFGEINAPTVVIASGVVFRGNCTMGQNGVPTGTLTAPVCPVFRQKCICGPIFSLHFQIFRRPRSWVPPFVQKYLLVPSQDN